MTTRELSLAAGVDRISKDASGNYTARRSFFYSRGATSEHVAARIKTALPQAVILDQGTVIKPFRGGAPLAQSTHWWVKFSVKGGIK